MEDGRGERPELDRQDGPSERELLDTDQPGPQNKASLLRWNRYDSTNTTVLEQELFPIALTITGNIAVAQYRYSVARENFKKDRETVTGRYTDVFIREGGRWLFIAWAGGDDPKQ